MRVLLEFVVLGLGTGAIYALLASGIVLIYRGSGVVNFAQGSLALLGAIVFSQLQSRGVAVVAALIAAVAAGAAAGVLVQAAIMRQLRDAGPVTRVIATLGVFITIEAAATLHYGSGLAPVAQFLPQRSWTVFGVPVASDRVLLLAIGVLMVIFLDLSQKRWRLWLATRAASENEIAVAALGWSPQGLAMTNWGFGGALAGLAGALIVPVTGLIVGNMVLLVVPALAAALVGRFDSFYWTLSGAVGIGVGQSLVIRYVHVVGAADALPFLTIIVVLVAGGRALPLRGHVAERLPSLGDGIVRPAHIVVCVAIGVVLFLWVFNATWASAFTVSLAVAIVLLSIVVITGYAGQISLAQYAVAGLGAWIAGRLVAADGVPFEIAGLIGVSAALPIGVIFALPALRTRGMNLAVITLGMGVAVWTMLFENPSYTGGTLGTNVGSPHIFGLNISASDHPERYGIFVLGAFALVAMMVANLRRSTVGRRMIAIRANERAAASLGVSVTATKIYAFAVAAAIAALGGILIAFQLPYVVFDQFGPVTSVTATGLAVIGGLGYIAGPLLGALFAIGGVGTLFNGLLGGIENYLPLVGGITVIVVILLNPDGLVPGNLRTGRAVRDRVRRSSWWVAKPDRLVKQADDIRTELLSTRPTVAPARAVPKSLEVSHLSVRFGGVVAVDDVSLCIAPGDVVGLIGPNGAGKTTIIDAVSGFVRSDGAVVLGGEPLLARTPSRRAARGVVRSWQELELFEDVTVLENLQVAAESGLLRWGDYVRAFVAPGRASLSAAAADAVRAFELIDDLTRRPSELSHGRRRLVGIARAVAISPSILLLDEPAAGLDATESRELGGLIRRLARDWGIGILLVEHDVDLVSSVSDRVVALSFGRKIAEGRPEEVRADPAVISAYLGEPYTPSATPDDASRPSPGSSPGRSAVP